MSLISRLLQTGAANPQARLKISRNPQGAIQGVVAQGKSTKGRVVEWFKEVGGGRGSVENREATQALIDEVRTRYGNDASDAVSQQLRDRLREGKPLSYRHVELAVATAKDVSMAERLANLGDGAIARQIIDDLVKQGALLPGGRDALLTQGSKDRAALEEAIKRAVLVAASQAAPRPLDPPTAFIAVKGAVHEAAAPLLAAAQDDQWSALGDDMDSPPLRAVIGSVAEALKQVKAFRAQRLNARLGGSAGADPKVEQKLMRDMSAQIGKLDNSALLKLYRTTLSADMVEVRLALANRANDREAPDPMARLLLEDLNSYEAMVQTEVIERTLPQTREVDDGSQIIDHGPQRGQLAALAATESRAAKRELDFQTPSYLRGEDTDRTGHPGAAAKLANTGLTTEQVADALRSADLTINVGFELFTKGGGFRDPSGKLVTNALRVKNIYELPQKKHTVYLERRKMVEYALEPATEQADRSGIDPSNHPISAGVNVGRRIDGAAFGYGYVVLVLRDSVKDRCTFTPSDSFNVFEARVTGDKIKLYKEKVAEMLEPGGGLLEAGGQALLDDPTKLDAMFTELEKMEGPDFGAGRPFLDAFHSGPLRAVDPDPDFHSTVLGSLLTNAAIDTFRKRPGAGGHVTTSERISHIVADLNQDVLDDIVTGVRDAQRINLPINNYIEAQVYGGVDLASDVAEIRYPALDTSQMLPQLKPGYLDSVEGLMQVAKKLGVPVVPYQPADVT
jgi:hypothetical protein